MASIIERNKTKFKVAFGPRGKRSSLYGIRSRATAKVIKLRVERLEDLAARGDQPSGDLLLWVQDLSANDQAKLVNVGLLDGRYSIACVSLESLIDEFGEWMRSRHRRGRKITQQQADDMKRMAKSVIDGCTFKIWRDISADKVHCHIANMRLKGLTLRNYARAIKLFTNTPSCSGLN